jgi:hypothetical protein
MMVEEMGWGVLEKEMFAVVKHFSSGRKMREQLDLVRSASRAVGALK